MGLLVETTIRLRHECPCLCTTEVEITVAVGGVVAPRQTVAIFSIVLAVLFVVIQTVEDALPQLDDLRKSAQIVEGIDFTLHRHNKGIHAVNAARGVEVADGLVEFL